MYWLFTTKYRKTISISSTEKQILLKRRIRYSTLLSLAIIIPIGKEILYTSCCRRFYSILSHKTLAALTTNTNKLISTFETLFGIS